MKLKPTYYESGKIRPYCVDEKGKEYLYFKDKQTSLIIRDFWEEDAIPWYNNMFKPGWSPQEKRRWVGNFQKIVRERKEEDPFFDLVVTTFSNKILGGVEVYHIEGDDIFVKAKIILRMRDEFLIKEKGKAFIQTILDLKEQYGWFPEGFLLCDEDGNEVILV